MLRFDHRPVQGSTGAMNRRNEEGGRGRGVGGSQRPSAPSSFAGPALWKYASSAAKQVSDADKRAVRPHVERLKAVMEQDESDYE